MIAYYRRSPREISGTKDYTKKYYNQSKWNLKIK